MDAEKYEEAVRDYEKITKMDHNHGKSQLYFLSLYFKIFAYGKPVRHFICYNLLVKMDQHFLLYEQHFI